MDNKVEEDTRRQIIELEEDSDIVRNSLKHVEDMIEKMTRKWDKAEGRLYILLEKTEATMNKMKTNWWSMTTSDPIWRHTWSQDRKDRRNESDHWWTRKTVEYRQKKRSNDSRRSRKNQSHKQDVKQLVDTNDTRLKRYHNVLKYESEAKTQE